MTKQLPGVQQRLFHSFNLVPRQFLCSIDPGLISAFCLRLADFHGLSDAPRSIRS